MNFLLQSLKKGLLHTREKFVTPLGTLFAGRRGLSDELLEIIEETLITTDIGVDTAAAIIDEIKNRFKNNQEVSYNDIIAVIKNEIEIEITAVISPPLEINNLFSPLVILVVGVNGTGKTTSIGKLAYYYKNLGKQVLLSAADTFRAAAIDQLEIWKDRIEVDIIKNTYGTDPAAVAYDSAQAAVSRKIDVLIIDTAGRIHTNYNLMQELNKIKRVLGKVIPGAPHKVLLVIDATMGQNAVSQARLFTDALSVTGIFLTKLDGTAKGGAVIPIMKQLQIPIEFIGIGEQKEDIRLFNISEFTEALFEN